jgi:endonuclease YncB( thermonuclease family)
MLALLFTLVVVQPGQSFSCSPEAVWDGDGPIWCQEGARIRLAGIATREMDGTCSPGHPCPTTGAIEARDALVSLVGEPIGVGEHGHILVKGPTMRCVSDGSAGGSRTAAWCISPRGGDTNCAMVKGGWLRRHIRTKSSQHARAICSGGYS